MMATGESTKEKLLSNIDDLEMIAKEMVENSIAPKMQRLSLKEHDHLTELLIHKDQEIKDLLKTASTQAGVQNKIKSLQGEIDKYDLEIKQLQKHLKEAEFILATAIFQAKKKLKSINRANKQPISSEELIKYAHRISASNAVAAPNTWEQGDPRRPYPTDIEMRLGFLGRLSDFPINGHILQQQSSLSDGIASRGAHACELPNTTNNQSSPRAPGSQLSWQPPSDISGMSNMPPGSTASSTNHSSVHNKENVEDVEVMSTDSSSSSSSDSQ